MTALKATCPMTTTKVIHTIWHNTRQQWYMMAPIANDSTKGNLQCYGELLWMLCWQVHFYPGCFHMGKCFEWFFTFYKASWFGCFVNCCFFALDVLMGSFLGWCVTLGASIWWVALGALLRGALLSLLLYLGSQVELFHMVLGITFLASLVISYIFYNQCISTCIHLKY